MSNTNIVQLHVIVNRKLEATLSKELCAHDVFFLNVTYARGSLSNHNSLLHSLGLVVEPKKAFITCLLKRENVAMVLDLLIKKYDFNSKNTGFAYVVPLDNIKH